MAKRARLHPITWIVSLTVGVAAAVTLSGPAGFVLRTFHQLLDPYYPGDPRTIVLAVLELALFTCSTAVVVEGTCRRFKQGWQPTRADLLTIALVLVIMVVVLFRENVLWQDAQRRYSEYHETHGFFSWEDSLPPRLPLAPTVLGIPLLFGLWCISYTVAWGALRALRSWPRRPRTPNQEVRS
jgi:hypothetical protein